MGFFSNLNITGRGLAKLGMALTAVLLTGLPHMTVAQPMTFELQGSGGNCNGCEWIAAKGEITADTPDVFRAFLEEHGQLYLYSAVTFDSPGGNLGAAIELGRLLRAAGATTTIGGSRPMNDMPFHEPTSGQCNSACVFAFLGGTARWVYDGELGVHQFYTPNGTNIPTAATQQIMGQIVLYLIEMGISPELLTLASRIPAQDMRALTDTELARLKITTAATQTPMRLEIAQGGLILRWDAMADDGTVERQQSLRCSQKQKAWILSVFHAGIGKNNYIINEDMHIRVGDRQVPLKQSAIQDISTTTDGTRLTVRLPGDLRDTPNADFSFETNYTRNFAVVLSASGTLPDADTLNALVRACGH